MKNWEFFFGDPNSLIGQGFVLLKLQHQHQEQTDPISYKEGIKNSK